ncbi:AMP-dependent synthetase/ligase [Pseudonocardia spinosispora]|uniref:AMP-dependent synthetase/ligase n=1 Tax=Pseudonocardia spinosispora TaxID=103441 RepID=UPI0004132F74|nr:long-chain fatty acid--CoA ligase [Pseudonocardia spinosispora]
MGNRHYRETLLDLVERNARAHPGVVAIVDGETRVSWAEYRQHARIIALALIDLGVAHGDVVGLHMVNRGEHALADIGALMAGATPTSYYNTLAAEQLEFVARDSGAVAAIVDAAQLPLWLSIRKNLPELRHLVVLDTAPQDPLPEGVVRFEQWITAAEAQLPERASEVERSREKVQAQDPLTIVYTSGTTGPPKGTIITHTAVLWVLDEVDRQLQESTGAPVPVGWSTVSYLPLAHVAERVFSHYQSLSCVLTVTYIRDIGQLPQVLPVARPYMFLGMPRVWEKIHSSIRERASTQKSPVRRVVGAKAIAIAQVVGTARLENRSPGFTNRMLYPVMKRLVYGKIRHALGLDRVVLAVSGAAVLSPDVMAFFAGIGITIIEVYGMTETSAMLTASPLDAPRLGSVGRALSGIELKTADDGEILARGPNITPGYLNRPDATEEAIDADGWLHTGDLGTVDEDGYLRITGRKKELINTASGKTISPGNVEQALARGSDLIGSVYVHGDDKPCLVALVTLDPTNWRSWCESRGIAADSLADAIADGRVRLDLARSIGAGNAALSRVEQVKNWTLLDTLWTVESGELTPTMKMKRSVIAERYRDEIEQLYDPLTAEAWEDG